MNVAGARSRFNQLKQDKRQQKSNQKKAKKLADKQSGKIILFAEKNPNWQIMSVQQLTKDMENLSLCDPVPTSCDSPKELPPETLLQIFHELNHKELATCSLVSKQWQEIASDRSAWKVHFYKQADFITEETWKRHIGDPGPQLTFDYRAIFHALEQPCPLTSEKKKVKDTHIALFRTKQIDGETRDRKWFLEKVKKPKEGTKSGYTSTWHDAEDKELETVDDAPYYYLMNIDPIPKSVVDAHPEFEVANLRQIETGIFMKTVSSGTYLCSDSYAHWKGGSGERLALGGNGKEGLRVVCNGDKAKNAGYFVILHKFYPITT